MVPAKNDHAIDCKVGHMLVNILFVYQLYRLLLIDDRYAYMDMRDEWLVRGEWFDG